MKRFKCHNVEDWEKVDQKDVLEFQAGSHGRTLKFLVNAVRPVACFASYSKDFAEETLLGCSDGLMEIEASCSKTVYIRFAMDKATKAYIRRYARDYKVHNQYLQKFVNLDFKKVGNPEFERMMLLMQHNQKEFLASIKEDQEKNAQLRKELLQMQEERDTTTEETEEVVENDETETEETEST